MGSFLNLRFLNLRVFNMRMFNIEVIRYLLKHLFTLPYQVTNCPSLSLQGGKYKMVTSALDEDIKLAEFITQPAEMIIRPIVLAETDPPLSKNKPETEPPPVVTDPRPVQKDTIDPHAFVRPEVIATTFPSETPTVGGDDSNDGDITDDDKEAGSGGKGDNGGDSSGGKDGDTTEGAGSEVGDDKKKPGTVTLHITLAMYKITPVILLIGIILQLIIAFISEGLLFAFITLIWYSIVDLLVIGAAAYTLLSTPSTTSCKISFFLSLSAIGSLNVAASLVTLYKFVAIRYPMMREELTEVWKQICWCAGSFISILLISSPVLWLRSITDYLLYKRGFCYFEGATYLYFIIAWIAVVIILPLVLNLAMFLIIGLKVKEQRRKKAVRQSTLAMTTMSSIDSPKGYTKLDSRPSFNTKIEVKESHFPAIIVVCMVLSIISIGPFVPAFINPTWFYSGAKNYLDVVGQLLFKVRVARRVFSQNLVDERGVPPGPLDRYRKFPILSRSLVMT
eukprot:sb/3464004/